MAQHVKFGRSEGPEAVSRTAYTGLPVGSYQTLVQSTQLYGYRFLTPQEGTTEKTRVWYEPALSNLKLLLKLVAEARARLVGRGPDPTGSQPHSSSKAPRSSIVYPWTSSSQLWALCIIYLGLVSGLLGQVGFQDRYLETPTQFLLGY